MRRDSLAFRLVASAALWCALLLTVGGLALSALFTDTVERNFDARLTVLLEGLVAGSELREDGRLELRLQVGEPRFDQPFSGWYWQIEPIIDGPVSTRRSPSLWDRSLYLGPSSGAGPADAHDITGPEGQPLRVLVRAITLPGTDAPLLYAVAGDRREITEDLARFNRLLAVALGALFLGLLAAVFVQVRFGLGPLRRIERGLAAIRGGRERRLGDGFPAEIAPLAGELNALLDHNEALIERARTHVGNLAHGLKTPLAVLTNEATRGRGANPDLIERQVAIMREQVDHHLARARTAASGGVIGARAEVAPVLSDLGRTLRRIHAERRIALETDCPGGLAFRGARQDLEEMLGNLLDNACKWASGRVAVRVQVASGRLRVMVEDDGPGLAPERRFEVLERGRRLDERMPGSGLGLAIVVDVAALYGGRLVLETSALGGLAAKLDLPAAPDVGTRR